MPRIKMKKVFKSYLKWDNVIFVIILAVIFFYLFFQVVVLKTENPQVAVTTTSMVPTYEGFDLSRNPDLKPHQYYDILRGDLLIVQNIEPHVGDVVVFNATMSVGGKVVNCNPVSGSSIPVDCVTPVVHRLIAERTVNGVKEFATKGDHNPTADVGEGGNNFGWIYRSAILGVVVFAIHHLGWFSLQLQSPFVRVLLIVAVIAIILFTLFDNSKPNKENEDFEKMDESNKPKVFLKFKKYKIQIHRPTLFLLFLAILLTSTYVGIGVVDYSSGHNTVNWLYNTDESNGIIDLHSESTQNYSNIYFYNYQLEISSSGFLNTVNKVEITPIYNNLTTNVVNPTYVWTIVYDYSGTKLIHAVMIFNVTNGLSNLVISTTIYFKIYSSGLLASPVQSFSVNMTVLA